jgi:L-fuconolactonase
VEIIDSQLHIWGPDTDEWPWVDPSDEWTRIPLHVSCDAMIDEMDKVGVDGAVLVSLKIYGWDNRYALTAAERYVDRFRVVGRIDPFGSDPRGEVEVFGEHPAAVGVRVLPRSPQEIDLLRSGGYEPILTAAEEAGLAVCFLAHHVFDQLADIAKSHPGLQIVIDHLGLVAPPPRDGSDPFTELGAVLELASHPNVALKLSGAPALSLEPYPFTDLWPHIHKIIDSYGVSRVMWGSDWTRVPNASYEESARFIQESDQLGDAEKRAIMGETLRSIFNWRGPDKRHGAPF